MNFNEKMTNYLADNFGSYNIPDQVYNLIILEILEKNKKEDVKYLKKEEHVLKTKNFNKKDTINKNKSKKNNFFMALCDDTSSDDEKTTNKNNNKNNKNNKKDEFPPLSLSKKNNISNTLCFKNIITITQEKDAKDKADKEEEEIFKRLNMKKITREEVQVIAAPIELLQVVTKKRNWADVDSSDEEEDDFQDHYQKENKFVSTYKNPYDDSDDDF
jgi:hypothetical protein